MGDKQERRGTHVLFTGRLSNLFDRAGHKARENAIGICERVSRESHPSYAAERRWATRRRHVMAPSGGMRKTAVKTDVNSWQKKNNKTQECKNKAKYAHKLYLLQKKTV